MRKADVVVIGAGAAGLTAAYTAKGFGKKVIMIDKSNPGGECTWSGCIPSKALINQANDVYAAKKYVQFDVDTKEIMSNVQSVIQGVYAGESVEVLEKDGISIINGWAKFVGPNLIEVNGEKIEAKKIFICTGSSPMIPPITGLSEVSFLTNESFFLQEELPKSIIVLGAGAIGTELSQAMNRLGVKVKLVEMADEILPREDKELTTKLSSKLIEEGIEILTSHKAVNVFEEDNLVKLDLEGPNGTIEISGEKLLLALGRQPKFDGMGFDEVGIEYDRRGIKVNDYLETSLKGIYAVGDCTGPYLFSHMANVQGIRAVQNAILPIKRKIDYTHVVWCTFTSPELATAGLSEAEAKKRYGDSIRVYRHSYQELDRAKTKPGSLGEVKLVLDSKGKVLGASILGDRAGELISEIQVIKSLALNYGKLAGVIHPYPTYSEILSKISKRVKIDNILNNKIVKTFRK